MYSKSFITPGNIAPQTTAGLLASYPRQRPELPEAHRAVYAQEYRANREGERVMSGAAQRLEQWMHRSVAAQQRPGATLELGGGTLNHLAFEPESSAYDVVEPFAALYKDSPRLNRVRALYQDSSAIPRDNRYQRIVSIAVLEHMTHLPLELARSGLMLEQGGIFQAGIPSEGGFLWWLGWRMTTGLSYALRHKLDYGRLIAHEHINTAPEIIALVRHFFKNVRLRYFPLPLHHLSLYVYIEADTPDMERCDAVAGGQRGV